MKKLNNFVNEKLVLNKQSKISKNFSDLDIGDVIYIMQLYHNMYTNIYSCTIEDIKVQDDDVIIEYICKNDRYHAVFNKSSFYDSANRVLISSNTYYFINKKDAKKVQTTWISNSIKKQQDELAKLTDPNHPNYRKNVMDREWHIKELEKEINKLIEKSNKYNNDQ